MVILPSKKTTDGRVKENNEVDFTAPNFNNVVSPYMHGTAYWSAGQLKEFLSEHVVSRDCRDVKRILFYCEPFHYDVQ